MELLCIYGPIMGLPSLLLSPGGECVCVCVCVCVVCCVCVCVVHLGDSFDEMQNNLTSSPDNPSGTHVSCEITLYTRSEAA